MFLAALIASSVSTACTFRPQLQLVPAVSRITLSRRDAVSVATAKLTFSVRTAAAAQANNDPGLQAHVRGYYVIARRAGPASQIKAVGTNASQARSRLEKTVAGLTHDATLEYARQARIYDAVTDNGRAQDQGPAYGFPDGPNARTYCAQ